MIPAQRVLACRRPQADRGRPGPLVAPHPAIRRRAACSIKPLGKKLVDAVISRRSVVSSKGCCTICASITYEMSCDHYCGVAVIARYVGVRRTIRREWNRYLGPPPSDRSGPQGHRRSAGPSAEDAGGGRRGPGNASPPHREKAHNASRAPPTHDTRHEPTGSGRRISQPASMSERREVGANCSSTPTRRQRPRDRRPGCVQGLAVAAARSPGPRAGPAGRRGPAAAVRWEASGLLQSVPFRLRCLVARSVWRGAGGLPESQR